MERSWHLQSQILLTMKSSSSISPDPTQKLLDIMSEFPCFSFHTASMITGLPEDSLHEYLEGFISCNLLDICVGEDGILIYERV